MSESGSQQQVTKSVYTVTTPASFVFFEQTISPASKHQETKTSERPEQRKRGPDPAKRKVNDMKNKADKQRQKHTQNRKKQIKNEIVRNSIIGSSENENKQSLTNLRIALQSNDVHYFPNREPYYPGAGGGLGGYRPVAPLPPVLPPGGGDYQPPTQIHTGHHPSSLPSPPVSSSYHPPSVPVYQPDVPVYQPELPVYEPEIPSITLPFFEPVNFHNPSYTKHSVRPFKETLLNAIPPRRYKKKVARPNKIHHSHSSGPPQTNFHFVEEFSNIPPNIKVKRIPSESSGSLDVKGPGPSIVDLLKSEDLTVMAALLEETELYKSVDKEGESVLVKTTSF